MIQALGARVLRDACRQVIAWHRQGMMLRLSVNLSVQQLQHDSWLVDRRRGTRRRADCPPHYLDLEITESVIITHPEKAVATLVKLKQRGVSITVDDFGTGYSSLSYLARLPIQAVKIDQRFVHGLEQNRNDEAITQAIIALSHSLGLRVIAEGVETAGAVRVPEAPRLRGGAGLPDLAPARGARAAELVADAGGGEPDRRPPGRHVAGGGIIGDRPRFPVIRRSPVKPAQNVVCPYRSPGESTSRRTPASSTSMRTMRSRCAATIAFAPSSPVSAASAA